MATPNGQTTTSTGLANFFCKLKIGKVDIPTDAINAIIIREWIFDIVPRLEITIQDNGTLFELWVMDDNTEITIEFGKNKDSDHIVSTFIVDSTATDILTGNSSNIISITAYLKYQNLFHPIHTRALKNKSSIDVLKQLAGEIGWKVNARTNSSSDTMTWLQINQSNFDMIKHVLERSSITNDLLMGFATIDNKFNIVSLKTETSDNTFKICRYDLTKAGAESFDNDQDKKTLWTNGYKFQNMMGYLNKTVGGYGLTSTFYDLKSKVSLSSSLNYHPYTQLSNQNHIGEHIDSINFGMMTANMHSNYYKGQITNRNLLGLSFGNMITAKVNPLGDVNMMDTVNMVLPSINAKQVNEIYGGFYLVCGKCYYASKGAPLQLELCMMRNGRNKSSFNIDATKKG